MTTSFVEKILDGSFKEIKEGKEVVGYYGTYNGYTTIIRTLEGNIFIAVYAYRPDDESNQLLEDYWRNMQRTDTNIIAVNVLNYEIEIGIKATMTLATNIININNYTKALLDYLSSNQYDSGCPVCKSYEKKLDFYHVNDTYMLLCKDCFPKVKNNLKQKQEFIRTHKKSNLLKGTIGAFIGSLIGGICWFGFYQFGKVAALAGILGTRFAMVGYRYLGKYRDVKGLIVSVLLSFLSIFVAHNLCWVQNLYEEHLVEASTPFIEVFTNLFTLLQTHDCFTAYIGELALGILLASVPLFWELKDEFWRANVSLSIKKKK